MFGGPILGRALDADDVLSTPRSMVISHDLWRRAFGARVRRLDVTWGEAADPALLQKALREGAVRAVLMTHNETSTGVLNDIRSLAATAREVETSMANPASEPTNSPIFFTILFAFFMT